MASAHLFLISLEEEELLRVCSSAALQDWVLLDLYGYLPHRVLGVTQGLGFFFVFLVLLLFCSGKSVKYRYIEFFTFDSLPISFQSGIAFFL